MCAPLNYWTSIGDSVASSQYLDYANGNDIEVGAESGYEEISYDGWTLLNRERATVNTQIDYGSIGEYSDSAKVDARTATASANIIANGALIDVQSHAENRNPADERLYDDLNNNGKQEFNEPKILVEHGSADFEVNAKDNLQASITANADANNVAIDPVLPNQIKKSIILEPYRTAFGEDYSQVVIPTLLDKGYSVLRYADSGASEEKFKELYDYNVVLIYAHMGPSVIDLSTTRDPNTGMLSAAESKLNAKRLRNWYDSSESNTPPAGSMVVLSGCSSLKPLPPLSWMDYIFTVKDLDISLNDAFIKSDLRVGFGEDAESSWANVAIPEFFAQMSSANTAEQAKWVINHPYITQWRIENPGVRASPLVMDGDENVVL